MEKKVVIKINKEKTMSKVRLILKFGLIAFVIMLVISFFGEFDEYGPRYGNRVFYQGFLTEGKHYEGLGKITVTHHSVAHIYGNYEMVLLGNTIGFNNFTVFHKLLFYYIPLIFIGNFFKLIILWVGLFLIYKIYNYIKNKFSVKLE